MVGSDRAPSPWQVKHRPLEEDIWELYNVDEDFSLTTIWLKRTQRR